MEPETPTTPFDQLAIAEPVLRAVDELGYETASPVQAQCIPHLLDGRDLLGQAQTGTGKTAAFALPLLSRVDLTQQDPQVLVLTPTRELALQVAEALQSYARYLPGFHVLPVYGGQGMSMQLRQLRRGAHFVVGTPGRVMDHIRRGSLNLSGLRTLVLDEADEMLNMGFVDDIEWIFEQAPAGYQVALFSATMPDAIRKVADAHLKDPVEVKVRARTTTGSTIAQRHCVVTQAHKLDLLTRILEVEEFDAMLVFVRTRTMTVELAEKLSAHGLAAEALNGDMSQDVRERTVNGLKVGRVDVVVATDVAARGLDVDRISHVVNYDIPNNPEAYVHRIGRTGRAGREGKALLFVHPRERHLLRAIERATGQRIEPFDLPTAEDLSQHRIDRFVGRVMDALNGQDLDYYYRLVARIEQEQEVGPLDIAAALTYLSQGERPFEVKELGGIQRQDGRNRERRPERGDRRQGRQPPPERGTWQPRTPGRTPDRGEPEPGSWADRGRPERGPARGGDYRDRPRPTSAGGRQWERPDGAANQTDRAPSRERGRHADDIKRLPYRIAVGREHGVSPGEIVGAIANELGLEGRHIGRIDIHDRYSVVGLPDGMPPDLFKQLRRIRVRGEALRARLWDEDNNRPRSLEPVAHLGDGRRPPRFADRPADRGGPPKRRSPRAEGRKKKSRRK